MKKIIKAGCLNRDEIIKSIDDIDLNDNIENQKENICAFCNATLKPQSIDKFAFLTLNIKYYSNDCDISIYTSYSENYKKEDEYYILTDPKNENILFSWNIINSNCKLTYRRKQCVFEHKINTIQEAKDILSKTSKILMLV